MIYGPGGSWRRKHRTDNERFDLFVEPEPTSGCWLWIGAENGVGYGVLRLRGKRAYAHRFSWERENGPVPYGYELDHLCRTRCCVNPDHLEVVTRRENLRRGDTIVGMFDRGDHVPRTERGTFATRT